MKIFISQPMRGLTIEEIKKERNDAIEFIKTHITDDFEVIDNIQEDAHYTHPLEYLGEDFKMLPKADIVLMWGDYLTHSGCRLEKEAAENYGIRVECADSYKFKRLQ